MFILFIALSCNNNIGTEQHYVENAPIYGTCLDLQYHDYDRDNLVLAGCSCYENYYLDDFGKCVASEGCTCYDEYEDVTKLAGEIARRGCANW